MLKLTIENVNKETADIITYIAKNGGGKVPNTISKDLKDNSKFIDSNILELRAHMKGLIKEIEKKFYDKNAKAIKTKVK